MLPFDPFYFLDKITLLHTPSTCRKPIVPLDRSSRPAVALLSPTRRTSASVQPGPAFTFPTPSPSVQHTAAQHTAAQHTAAHHTAAQHAAYIPAPSNLVPHHPGSLGRAGRQVSYGYQT